MKRSIEVAALLAVLLALGLMMRPAQISPEPIREARAVWNQQLLAIQNGQSTTIVMPDFQLSPGALSELKTVAAQITELNLSGLGLAPDMSAITNCTHLRILHLRTEIGDPEIRTLAQLRELEVLDLPLATGVTDAGLKALEGHPKLKLVRLRAAQVTDAGLASFPQLPELRWLHLMEVPITDAGLEVLKNMSRLQSLYLDGDRATDEGLSDLVLARPDLHFHRDQVHLPTDPKLQDGHRD